MGRKRTLRLPDNRTVSAEEINYKPVAEQWSEYVLDDGAVLRVRPIVTEVLRVEGEYDPQGTLYTS